MPTKIELTKRFDTGSLADGATWEKQYTVTEDYILERIFIQDVDGGELNKSLFHLEVGAKNVFADDLPAKNLTPALDENLELNLDCPKETIIKMIFKNLEGATKQCYITLVFVKSGA